MIGKIKGILTEVEGVEGLVETAGGVSYRVYLTPSMLALLPPAEVEIYTYLQIREDQHVLYGFDSKEQHKMFHMLLSVDGVGPKTAHGVISRMATSSIINAVHHKDVQSFTDVPGLGKKTAQKILLELSSKLKTDLDVASLIETPVNTDALDALVALGYKITEAREMLKSIDPQLSVEKQITAALQQR